MDWIFATLSWFIIWILKYNVSEEKDNARNKNCQTDMNNGNWYFVSKLCLLFIHSEMQHNDQGI